MDVTQLASGHQTRIGGIGNVLITVLDGMANLESLELIDTTQGQFVAQNPRIVVLNVIASPRLSSPPAGMRERSAKLFSKYEANLACSAIVVKTNGLAAVIARSFLAAYQLLIPQKVPQRTFRDLPEAVAWCQTHSPDAAKQPRLAEALERFVKP
jgi:hypothetical protein